MTATPATDTSSVETTRERPISTLDGIAITWTTLALLAAIAVPFALQTTTPVFQVLWLVVPLAYLLRYRDAAGVGIRAIGRRAFLRTTVAAGVAYAAVLLVAEPLTGTYGRLLELAVDGPDPTFAWLVRFDGPEAWIGLLLFSGLVTLYAEELFFRGWLLNALKRRTSARVAVVGQALVFTLFQSIPVLYFGPVQAVAYLVGYAFGLGVIVGVAADRTGSIWPGLVVVIVGNLALSLLLF